jgi:thiamine kinase-like enzyme
VPELPAALGLLDSDPVVLEGGITNRNFRVRLGGRDCVVRLAGKDTQLLGIDRQAECQATSYAAELGIAPAVVEFLPDDECLVTTFISGRPLEPEEVRERATGIAEDLRAVHAGPPLPSRFDVFEIVDAYRATTLARGGTVPDVFGDLRTAVQAVEVVFTGPEHEPVPCHNDLLAGNFMYDGERVRILDWEYAGMGDRYFDLGNLSVNNGFDEDDDRRLLAAYWGEPCTERRFAALRLMRVMSDFREGMWGVVQRVISDLEFDFAGYADEHLKRVQAGFDDPRFGAWLEAARAG